jgi:hypothetical protein
METAAEAKKIDLKWMAMITSVLPKAPAASLESSLNYGRT